jgi:hypothetical protein
MLFVSIGIDCDVANFLNKYNLRKASLPFDWNVSYNGVSKCIENDFNNFTKPLSADRINEDDIYFHHDFLDIAAVAAALSPDHDKYHRRCERLLNLFKTAETTGEFVLFIRKGHLCYHHEEQKGKYKNIMCDVEDAKRLSGILRSKYPLLKYKIIVVLGCTKCGVKDADNNDDTLSLLSLLSPVSAVSVYNNVNGGTFEECMLNIVITEIRENN